MTFPLESVQLLLNMVQGKVKFDLTSAIQAALAIAQYLTSAFGTKSAALPLVATPDFGLEQALAQVKAEHKATTKYHQKHAHLVEPASIGISTSVLYFILQEVMKWIAEQMAK